jgi:presenilin-like A22 family membrane protease
MNARALRGVAIAALLFLGVQVGALALVTPFYDAGYQATPDPADPVNSVVYLVAILVVTAAMLAAFRYDFDLAVRAVVIFSGGLLTWYVFSVAAPAVVVAGVNVVPLGLAAAIVVGLLAYPEWYVVDAAGVVMGAGGAGLFGISFGLLPAILLLVVLAVYDAISVYGTEHMLTLASGVLELRVPVVLVVPLTLSYSLLDVDFSPPEPLDDEDEDASPDADAHGDASGADSTPPAATDGEGSTDDGGRDAFFIGLGDAVMPTVLVASAAFFSAAPALGLPLVPSANLPALGAMVGTFCGLFVLLWAVFRGRPHAGLPLLNGGAIGGYLLASVAAGIPVAAAVGL